MNAVGKVVTLVALLVFAGYVEDRRQDGLSQPITSSTIDVEQPPTTGLSPLDMPLCTDPGIPFADGPCQWAAGGEVIVTTLEGDVIVHTYPDGVKVTEDATIPPCEEEDSPAPCRWDAEQRGNGIGTTRPV